MTFFQFAAEHGGLAALFVVCALAVVVVPVWLVTRYLRDRLPEMSSEDRGHLTQAATFLRINAQQYDWNDARRDKREQAAEALERMAAR